MIWGDAASYRGERLAGAVGLEPTPSSLTVRCPTNWTTPQQSRNDLSNPSKIINIGETCKPAAKICQTFIRMSARFTHMARHAWPRFEIEIFLGGSSAREVALPRLFHPVDIVDPPAAIRADQREARAVIFVVGAMEIDFQC